MKFYLGLHQPHWLASAGVLAFVSHLRLTERKKLPVAAHGWALDSGGFSVLQKWGYYPFTVREYAAAVLRYSEGVGKLEWAASMDWMCEAIVIAGGTTPRGIEFAGTGLSVKEHQSRTVRNYLELKSINPALPFAPVLQGFTSWEYDDCREMYEKAGVDLLKEPVVGLGSVCRRENTSEAEDIVLHLAKQGLRLHLFGFKLGGLERVANACVSADSMAWSYGGRSVQCGYEGHTHKNAANCLPYGLAWREKVIAVCERAGRRPLQFSMF